MRQYHTQSHILYAFGETFNSVVLFVSAAQVNTFNKSIESVVAEMMQPF